MQIKDREHKVKKYFGLGLVILFLIFGNSMANTVSLTVGEILNLSAIVPGSVDHIFTNVTPNATNPQWTNFGSLFADQSKPNIVVLEYAFGSAQNWSTFSTFGLDIANVNEVQWSYQLIVYDGSGSSAVGSAVTLSPGLPPSFSFIGVALTGIDKTDITRVQVVVSQVTQLDGTGAAEYIIAPALVPEPGVLTLLGLGLLAVPFARRLKK